tara:strand:- start:1 stop:621 length:621 start_codon:yes stop_codon:yes gene_type:complete
MAVIPNNSSNKLPGTGGTDTYGGDGVEGVDQDCPDGETNTFVPGLPAFGIPDSWKCLAEGDNGYAEVIDEDALDEMADEGELCADGYYRDDTYVWYKDGVEYTGACLPSGVSCATGTHWQPGANGDGTDGECVDDALGTDDATVIDESAADNDATEGFLTQEEIDALIAAAGPTFTPVVSCCITELGNAIATSLIGSYGSELATIY